MNGKKAKKTLVILLVPLVIALSFTTVFSEQIQKDNHNRLCKTCLPNNFGYTPLNLSEVTLKDLPAPTTELPSIFDWRNIDGEDWTTPIRDQGQCGSCWAFGAMASLEAAINLELNDSTVDIDLSEQYLVSCYPGHGCDEGGHAYYGWRWLDRRGGALAESCFPYEASDVPCDEKCDNYEELLVPLGDLWTARNPSEEEIKQALLEYGPLVADMAVYNDIQLYRGGVYVHPQLPDETEDDINHQPVIVGYNDNENCWIMKNSWGTSWGEDTYGVTGERGWFRIRYGDCFIGTGIHGIKSNLLQGNDTGTPVLEVQHPQEGWVYVFDNPTREVFFGRTKIIGALTIQAEAYDIEIEDEEVTGIHCVEFFIDDVSESCDTEPPYELVLRRNLGFHELRIVAFDNAGNPSNQITIDFLKLL